MALLETTPGHQLQSCNLDLFNFGVEKLLMSFGFLVVYSASRGQQAVSKLLCRKVADWYVQKWALVRLLPTHSVVLGKRAARPNGEGAWCYPLFETVLPDWSTHWCRA